ncbi:MAG: hypothetical protein K2Q20_05180, partial [Phycisphaerales bacterium]|nr:hypothetical protein [Phycisphaerales bacterium]
GCSLAEVFGLPKDHEDVRSLIRRSKLFVEDRWFGGCVPFGSDGCGSVHVLIPSPVGPGYWTAFCDHETEHDESRPIDYYTASSLWHFLIGELRVSRGLREPEHLSEHPWISETSSWPFDREIVAEFDADLAAYDGPFAPWAID